MTNTQDFEALTIRAGKGIRDIDQTTGHARYRYTVRVKSDATGAEIRFTYFDSAHNYNRGKNGLAGDDLLFAFWSFVNDAQIGEYSPEDFADLVHGMNYAEGYRIHEACKRARAKFGKLYHDDRDPATTLERLAAIGIE